MVSRNWHDEFLDLKVNSTATPGDEIQLTGAGTLPVTVVWTANQNLSGTIELVQRSGGGQQDDFGDSEHLSKSDRQCEFHQKRVVVCPENEWKWAEVHTAAVFVKVEWCAGARERLRMPSFTWIGWMSYWSGPP